jgi:hypothetical protein
MTNADKKIEALASEYRHKVLYDNRARILPIRNHFKAGAKAGIKLERERSQSLLQALEEITKCHVGRSSRSAIELAKIIARQALREHQNEGSGK